MAYTNLPPNLYDYFSTVNQRIRKLESAPDQAMTTATSAQSTASTAYTQAVTAETNAALALANAATAYSAAIGSLQPSASTIVNSTNQMTAISTNGITVYSGSSSSSGARVVMNSAGIAGYDSSGSATFAIVASTGAASFKGSITGSSITGSTLNIGGNFYVDGSTGLLTCTGATITGTITANAGSFTGSIYASGGTIGGFTINSTGFTNGSNMQIYNNGNITSLGTIDAVTIGATYLTSSSTLVVSGGSTFGSAATFNTTATVSGYFYNSGYATTTSSANAYINSSTGLLARSSSSLRYKLDVEPQVIPVASILQLSPKSFIDKASADAQGGSTNGLPRILGLIAEEIAQIPVLADLLMNKNEQGQPDSVNYDRVAVALIPLLQDLNTRLTKLEGTNGTTTSA